MQKIEARWKELGYCDDLISVKLNAISEYDKEMRTESEV
jgi:hypothetical protein